MVLASLALGVAAGLLLFVPLSPLSLVGGPDGVEDTVALRPPGREGAATPETVPDPMPPNQSAAPDAEEAPPAPEPTPSAPPAVEGASGDSLFDPPTDRAAFIDRVREQSVTIYCEGSGTRSTGSGWAFDPASLGASPNPDGTLIVTNGHVTEGCRFVTVQQGDKTYSGEVTAVDFIDRGLENDFAIVRIDARLPTLPVSTEFLVGHWVIASGSPSGLVQTVTTGIISNDQDDLIWTDAAINPGNSGGPLINSAGQVIGVNTWGLAEAPSIGIAIPIRRLCDRLFACS